MNKLIVFFILFSTNSFASSSIKFLAKTDGPEITVEGEVKKMQVHLDMDKLESTTVSIDVMDLVSGMDSRDEHMHKKVFSANKANDAKIDFAVTKMNCPADKKDELVCDSTGKLTIKSVTNELRMKVTVNKKDKTVIGSAPVSLKQFKLDAPSFMGITVLDSVDVNFKVSAE